MPSRVRDGSGCAGGGGEERAPAIHEKWGLNGLSPSIPARAFATGSVCAPSGGTRRARKVRHTHIALMQQSRAHLFRSDTQPFRDAGLVM